MAYGYEIIKLDSAGRLTYYKGANTTAPITCIAIDSLGIKWVGTTQGLFTFNGTFTNVNSGNNSIALSPIQNITCLGIGKKNTLYIGGSTNLNGSGQGGFVTLQGNHFTAYSAFGNEIKTMQVDSNGFATIGAAYYIGTFDGSHPTQYNVPDRVSAVFSDKQGDIWYGSSIYLKKWSNYTSLQYDIRNAPISSNEIGCIEIENGTTGWVANNSDLGGLNKLSNGEWNVYDHLNTNNSFSITALHVDSKGNKWIGGKEGELLKFNGSSFKSYPDFITAGWNNIQNIKEDPSGNIWLTAQIMAKFNGSYWTIYNNSIDLPTGYPIVNFDMDKQGTLWAGTSSGLYGYSAGAWSPYGNYYKQYFVVHVDKFGNKWLSTLNGGLEKFDGNNFTTYTSSNSPLPNNQVTAITTDSSGVVWAGCQGGYLVRFDGSSWKVIGPDRSGIPSANVTCIKADAKGNKWIGTEHGLVIYNENGVNVAMPVAPYLAVGSPIINPKLSDTLSGCSRYVVTVRNPFLENAVLWFSSDGGATWEWSGTFNSGSSTCNWNVPSLTSNRCKLRLITSLTRDTVYNTGLFSVRYTGNALAISNPKSTQVLYPGEKVNISWTADANTAHVNLDYSIDYGKTWTNIAYYVPSPGSYNWTVPVISSPGTYIKVSDYSSGCTVAVSIITVGIVNSIVHNSDSPVQLLVYPNPSNGVFYLRGNNQGMDFLILDATGKEVPFHAYDEGMNTKIVVPDLLKGLFCLYFKAGNNSAVKFVME